MLQPAYRWRRRDADAVAGKALAVGRSLGLSDRQVALLAGRGHGPERLASFVGPPRAGLCDPVLLPDAAAVVARVAGAVRRRERVLVFGDFDADGLTGLAVMVEALRAIGLEVDYHVPGWIADGHGLSRRAVAEAAARGCRLIVTVDCGTASAEEVALAAEQGIDVIVSDHHHVPPELPPAIAVVNPQRNDSAYPDRDISGAGVAFKLVQLLLAGALGGPAGRPSASELAELAAIGTVADVAPLVGENRAIVRLGLDRLRERPRPGLRALLERAGVEPARLDVETIGYVVAPRLNAVGRLGDATVAARLLLSRDPTEAELLADELEAANSERRTRVASALDEVRSILASDPAASDSAIVTAVGPWSPGIVGLIAACLAEEYRRPALVVSTEVTPWRASARSGNGFDLARALEACSTLLERYGGHPNAAGCSFVESAWEPLRQRLRELAGGLPESDPVPTLLIDLALPASEVDYRLLRELEILEPSGPGNPPALAAVTGLEVLRARVVNGGHSQLTLRKGREVLDAIAFERPDIADGVAEGDAIDVVARLTSRTFGGFESLQLDVRDAAPAGRAPWDGSPYGPRPAGVSVPAELVA